MSKKLIIILIFCCFFMGCHRDCNKKKEAPFKEGDSVVLHGNSDPIVGIIHRVEKNNREHLYHVKVYNEKIKGHVVHRVLQAQVFEFIEEPR